MSHAALATTPIVVDVKPHNRATLRNTFTVSAHQSAVPIGMVRAALTAGQPTLNVDQRPIGTKRRFIVTDVDGIPFGELADVTPGDITWQLNAPEQYGFTVPSASSDSTTLLASPLREVQLWRGNQVMSWGPAVRPAADAKTLTVAGQGAAWWLTRRTIGRVPLTNYVQNGDFDDGLSAWLPGGDPYWFEADPVLNTIPTFYLVPSPTLIGTRSMAISYPRSDGAAVMNQMFLWTPPPDGENWTLSAYIWVDPSVPLVPATSSNGLTITRGSTTQYTPDGRFLATIEVVTATIDAATLTGKWVRLECTLAQPVTGEPEWVTVELAAPQGLVYWSHVTLTRNESLSFTGADRTGTIVPALVAAAQDTTLGKSSLNIGADAQPCGVVDTIAYEYAAQDNAATSITNFTALDDGFDVAMRYTATTRTVTTAFPRAGRLRPDLPLISGGNVTDWTWAWDGETAASQVSVIGQNDGARDAAVATDAAAFGGVIIETSISASPETSIASLPGLAQQNLSMSVNPVVLTVITEADTGTLGLVGVIHCGDILPCDLRRGGLSYIGNARVAQVVLHPDDTMDLTLNSVAA